MEGDRILDWGTAEVQYSVTFQKLKPGNKNIWLQLYANKQYYLNKESVYPLQRKSTFTIMTLAQPHILRPFKNPTGRKYMTITLRQYTLW